MHQISSRNAACTAGKPGPVLPLDAACLRALATAAPLTEAESLPLNAAVGRVVAAPVTAAIAVPPFDNSAMDGYAIRTSDLAGSGPWTLPVADRIRAGDPARPMLRGSAARIFTGAPVPEDADCVIMQERVRRVGDFIRIDSRPEAGANIRRAGEDLAIGGMLAPGRVALTAPRAALLAAQGLTHVSVVRRVQIAILSTGNELVDPGEALGPGQIYNSNRTLLAALLSLPFIDLTDLGRVDDDPAMIRAAIRNAAGSADVILTTGGVSAGEEDHMLDVLRREEARITVLKVAMRPGKPVTVGRIGRALYVGLPGNPYAALVTALQIALPAIRRIAGLDRVKPRRVTAVAGFAHDSRAGSVEFIPVRLDHEDAFGRPVLVRLGPGASARLAPVAGADGIAVIAADVSRVEAGDRLWWEPFADCQFV